jgi:hypothetical protein
MRRRIALLAALITVAAITLFAVPGSPAQAAGCWVTPNPATTVQNGAGLALQYTNCNGYGAWVMPYAEGPDLQVFEGSCGYSYAGQTTTWGFTSTLAGYRYNVAFCRPDRAPSNRDQGVTLQDSCWTHFDPEAPQGGQMIQYYYDCNYDSARIGTAYRTATALHVYENSCQTPRIDTELWWTTVVSWWYEQTVPNVNYTTVYCLGKAG